MMGKSTVEIKGLKSDKVWDFENGFYWFSHPSRLNKLIAQYELYKTIVNLPGDCLEFGVYKGISLVRLATFRGALENDYSRKIIGFDAFGAFPVEGIELDTDQDFIKRFEDEGGEGLSLQDMESLLKLKNIQNVDLVKGNVFNTLPKYLEQKPATKIAYLHLDMDVKEPTAFVLDQLYDRVVPGGVIVFDDYNAVEGATQAVDEFILRHGLSLEKLPHNYIPTYVRKSI